MIVSTKQKRRIALVIGNGRYNELRPLPNPVHDADAMTTELRGLGFQVDRYADLTQFELHKAFHAFIEKASEPDIGVCLFFYSGHGLEIGGQNYLMPVEISRPHSAQSVGLFSLQHYLSKLGACPFNGEIIVILDACRTNPFGEESADAAQVPLKGEVSRFNPDLLFAPEKSFIAFATAPGEVASDGPANSVSPFTRALKVHLATNGLEINEMMRRVRNELLSRVDALGAGTIAQPDDAALKATRRKKLQIPWTTSSLTEHFYFKLVSNEGLLTITLLGAASALLSAPIRFGVLNHLHIIDLRKCKLGIWCDDPHLYWNGVWFAVACAYGMWRWGDRNLWKIASTFIIYAAIAQLGVLIVSATGEHINPANTCQDNYWRDVVVAATGGAVTAGGAVVSGAMFSPALRQWTPLITSMMVGALASILFVAGVYPTDPQKPTVEDDISAWLAVAKFSMLAAVWHGLIAYTVGRAYVCHVPHEPHPVHATVADRLRALKTVIQERLTAGRRAPQSPGR